MDGIHDLGGMDGFGEITVEKNEPTFHSQWEGQAFALNIVAIGILQKYNADEYRQATLVCPRMCEVAKVKLFT